LGITALSRVCPNCYVQNPPLSPFKKGELRQGDYYFPPSTKLSGLLNKIDVLKFIIWGIIVSRQKCHIL
jgi:hypothetical protein